MAEDDPPLAELLKRPPPSFEPNCFEWEDRPGPTAGPFAAFDDFGRRIPRRLGIADYLLTIARSEPARVRRVPSAAVVEEGDDDDGPFGMVTCPCGGRPIVRSVLEPCVGDCDRYYVRFDGGMVFVAYAGEPPPLRR